MPAKRPDALDCNFYIIRAEDGRHVELVLETVVVPTSEEIHAILSAILAQFNLNPNLMLKALEVRTFEIEH